MEEPPKDLLNLLRQILGINPPETEQIEEEIPPDLVLEDFSGLIDPLITETFGVLPTDRDLQISALVKELSVIIALYRHDITHVMKAAEGLGQVPESSIGKSVAVAIDIAMEWFPAMIHRIEKLNVLSKDDHEVSCYFVAANFLSRQTTWECSDPTFKVLAKKYNSESIYPMGGHSYLQ